MVPFAVPVMILKAYFDVLHMRHKSYFCPVPSVLARQRAAGGRCAHSVLGSGWRVTVSALHFTGRDSSAEQKGRRAQLCRGLLDQIYALLRNVSGMCRGPAPKSSEGFSRPSSSDGGCVSPGRTVGLLVARSAPR